MSKLSWAETAPGVWRCVVGRPSGFTPLSVWLVPLLAVSGLRPASGVCSLPWNVADQHGKVDFTIVVSLLVP